jgi:hypothetical protein
MKVMKSTSDSQANRPVAGGLLALLRSHAR